MKFNLMEKLLASFLMGFLVLRGAKAEEIRNFPESLRISSEIPERLEEKYTAKMENADLDIAGYLERECRDKKERAIIYYPRTRKIEDITNERDEKKVSFDDEIISKRLRENQEIIFAHSHIVALSLVYDPKNKEHRKAMGEFGEYRLRRRCLGEFLSVKADGNDKDTGDIGSLLYVLFDNYPKNPKLKFQTRLVVLETWLPPRVISYGVKENVKKEIRGFSYTRKFGEFVKRNNIRKLMIDYARVSHGYIDGCRELFDVSENPGNSEKKEPSFREYARLVNEKTGFFIKD